MWWICYVFAILIFPFVVKIKMTYVKKQYYNIKLYIFGIRVLYFFIEFGVLKLKLIFNRKYYEVNYYKILPFNKAVNDILDIKVFYENSETFYCSLSENNNFIALFLFQYYLLISNTLTNIKRINSFNNLYVMEENEYFKYKLKIKLLFNVVTIIEALIKILIGKIIKWKKKIIE